MTDDPPTNSEEIIRCAKLDWTVGFEPMKSDSFGTIPNYNVLYREDNNTMLGVVDKAAIDIVQNDATFQVVDPLMGKSLSPETAASLGKGETVFGCFKIHEQYKLLDDDVDHYFVIVNDHLRPDGRVTVINTPIRVVCQNTLTAALGNNIYKARIPLSAESSIAQSIADNMLESVGSAIINLQDTAEEMVKQKIDRDYVERTLDLLFPYNMIGGVPEVSNANERIAATRNLFLTQCMDADNLQNYKNTRWQVLMAVTDFEQHFFKDTSKVYDLNFRMSKIPGVKATSDTIRTMKYLKAADKLAA